MTTQYQGASGDVMRRVLATEAAARRAEEEARLEAASRLERARADARAIEARAVERVQRMHERAQEADERQCEKLWQDARRRLRALDSAIPDDRALDRAAELVASWFTVPEAGDDLADGDA